MIETLKAQRVALLLISLGLFGFAMLITATLGSFEADLDTLFDVTPDAFKAMLKTQDVAGADLDAFLAAAAYRHPLFLIILLAFIIASAAGAMAREIERGTVFFLLARPIPRSHLPLARLGAMLLGLLLFLLLYYLGIAGGVLAFDLSDVSLSSLFLVLANALFLTLAIGGYCFLVSALASEGGTAIAIATGISIISFFLDYLASLWDAAEFLGPLSVFHYYDPVSTVIDGAVPLLHLSVLGSVALAGFAAAVLAFQRRDIAR